MKNMTKGKPLKLIFLFALPLMLGNILQQLYTMVDTMIVGQFLGVNALASLGAADWINWAILGIVMGFTQGFSIRISRTFGAEDYGNMKRSMHMIFFLCAFFSILTTAVAELSIVPLLTLLNTPSNVIQGSITYLRIMSGGLTITMFYNCFSSILRSLGDSRTPLLAIISALIYVLSPADIIPDGILGVGYLDDAAVVTICWKLVKSDVEEYKRWRQMNGKVI